MKHTKLFNRRSFLRAAGSAFMLSALGPLATGCGGSGGGSFTRIRSEVEVREPGGAFLYSDYQALLSAVQDLVDTIYRSEPFFSFGDRVTIKPNLISSDDWEGLSAALTYTTHASVVRALGEALLDQGAGSLVIAEGTTSALGTPAVFQALGYDEVAEYLGASLIDLNHPDPWPDLAEKDVPGGLVYDSIQYNRVLDETDCLVSAAKLKEHTSAGVTLSLKNLVGILPLSVYRSPFGISRGEYVHGAGNQLISGNIVDLARSFPIRFALIDGLAVSLGGEALPRRSARSMGTGTDAGLYGPGGSRCRRDGFFSAMIPWPNTRNHRLPPAPITSCWHLKADWDWSTRPTSKSASNHDVYALLSIIK